MPKQDRLPTAQPDAAATPTRVADGHQAGKAARRARIVQAARDLLREAGTAGLSMRALAERAGVSPATPYNLFGSKQAILISVLEDIRDFGRDFSAAAARSPLERLLQATALAVGFYEKDPDFYRVLWTTLLASDAGADRQAIFNPKRDAFWLQLLQDAVAADQLRADIALPLLARALDRAFRGSMLDWVAGELATAELQASIGYAHVLVLQGAATAQGRDELASALQRFQRRLLETR